LLGDQRIPMPLAQIQGLDNPYLGGIEVVQESNAYLLGLAGRKDEPTFSYKITIPFGELKYCEFKEGDRTHIYELRPFLQFYVAEDGSVWESSIKTARDICEDEGGYFDQ
jgi:hypothetical protein